jgi:hypothetical protein
MKPDLDRIDFRPDQCLAGADLTQASRRTADLLALHAARHHGVWGVATGLACTLNTAASGVVVGAGVALDACGHQLIISAPHTVPLPVTPGDGNAYLVDLVATAATTAELADGCRPAQLPVEATLLRWETAGPAPADSTTHLPYSPRVRLGIDVPIARLTTATAGAATHISTGSRPVAHGLVRPKIVSGHVPQSVSPVSGSYANWSMTVHTDAAGFEAGTSPVYLVTLDAHPFGETATLRADSTAGPQLERATLAARIPVAEALGVTATPAPVLPPDLTTRMQTWVGPFVSIEGKDNASFTLRVVTAGAGQWANNTEPLYNPVPVSWTAIDTRDPGPFVGWWWWLNLENEIPVVFL